jgi:hypothetical protein
MAAVRVMSDGSAEVIGPLTPLNAPAPEEAEHVSRLVATHLLELTSGSVQRDLAKGMALMTASFQRVYSDRVLKDKEAVPAQSGAPAPDPNPLSHPGTTLLVPTASGAQVQP